MRRTVGQHRAPCRRVAVAPRSGGPLSITELTEGAEVTRQAVTKHLGVLAAAGVVHDIWQGRERVWELETRQLEQAQRALDSISKGWDAAALERLRVMVEE